MEDTKEPGKHAVQEEAPVTLLNFPGSQDEHVGMMPELS